MTGGTRIAVTLVACTFVLSPLPGCAPRDSSPDETSRAAVTSRDDALPATARSVVRWLPGARPIAGWRRVRAPEVFGPDDLWESIDGGAETYVTFGFQELVTMRCSQPELGTEATIEVYRMADDLGAFGVYAQERNPSATFLPIGTEGYTAPNIVNFWNGPYYVKLTAMKVDDRASSALVALAGEISRSIGPPGSLPARSLALPERGQVPHSLKYVPRDILGQSYLVNGFEAQYQIDGKTCRLVTASLDSPAEAADAFARYRKFVHPVERAAQKAGPSIDEAFVGADSFNGSIVAVRADATLAIALGVPSQRAAFELLDSFLARGGHRAAGGHR